MASVVLSGYGPRYEKLSQLIPTSFYKMDVDEDILKVHFGENPGKDVSVWVRGTNLKSMTQLGNELKRQIIENNNLDMIIIDDFNPNINLPSFQILITRDGVITFFQRSEDLNTFLINKFSAHMEL